MGNNLFQYFSAKFFDYKDETVRVLNCPSFLSPKPNFFKRIVYKIALKLLNNVTDEHLINDRVNLNFLNIFTGYGELPKIFKNKRSIIKQDFEKNIFFEKRPQKLASANYNVVLHLRLGDRFLRKSDYEPGMQYNIKNLHCILNEMKIRHRNLRLFIVTDFKRLQENLTFDDFQKLDFHVKVPEPERIEYVKANSYLNSLQKFIHSENGEIISQTTLSEDFSYMYFSDTLIFCHGTLAWWAGFLGNQDKVFVAEQWRPAKGVENRNLSKVMSDERWHLW